MIHIIDDWGKFHVGLNIRRSPWGFKLIWMWITLYEGQTEGDRAWLALVNRLSYWSVRIRMHKYPLVIFDKYSYSLTDELLADKDQVVLSKDQYDDLLEFVPLPDREFLHDE